MITHQQAILSDLSFGSQTVSSVFTLLNLNANDLHYATNFACDNYTGTRGNYLTLSEIANLLFSHIWGVKTEKIFWIECMFSNYLMAENTGEIIGKCFQSLKKKQNKKNRYGQKKGGDLKDSLWYFQLLSKDIGLRAQKEFLMSFQT